MTDLQQLEARALAAEVALVGTAAMAQVVLDFTPHLVSDPLKETLQQIAGVQVDLTSARELIEKAESLDKLAKRIGAIDQFEHMRFSPSSVAAQCETNLALREKEADTLRTRLAESEALVERLKGEVALMKGCCENPWAFIKAYSNGPNALGRDVGVVIASTLLDVITRIEALTPADALQGYRDEVLEEVGDYCDAYAEKETNPYCKATARIIAADIRAMKGGTR